MGKRLRATVVQIQVRSQRDFERGHRIGVAPHSNVIGRVGGRGTPVSTKLQEH